MLLSHYGTPESSDLFIDVLTMLDPHVALTVVPVLGAAPTADRASPLEQDLQRARQLKREVECQPLPPGDPTKAVAVLAAQCHCDLVIVGTTEETPQHPTPLELPRSRPAVAMPGLSCLPSARTARRQRVKGSRHKESRYVPRSRTPERRPPQAFRIASSREGRP